jgi:hypothetical protein
MHRIDDLHTTYPLRGGIAGGSRGRAVVAAALGLALLAVSLTAAAKAGAPAFTGDRAETESFLDFYRTIELTPEQEAIRVEALSALPAPCCSNFSAATCCCQCNMARATWGLAKHLIVGRGADAAAVREAVAAWHRAINPDGFSGDACFTGGCARAFAKNGCGGMKETNLVY